MAVESGKSAAFLLAKETRVRCAVPRRLRGDIGGYSLGSDGWSSDALD